MTQTHRAIGDAADMAAFLEPSHLTLAGRLVEFRTRALTAADPDDDGAARRAARAYLRLLTEADLLGPTDGFDVRALCLTRETLSWTSPLADAVLAVQGLAATAVRLGLDETTDTGHRAAHQATLDGLTGGRLMGAFAMSEPGAGSDVSAITTQARAEDGGWVLEGDKHLISNAGIADVYVTFAVTTPGAGSRGLSAFLVPADVPGLGVVVQHVASGHPLGRLRLGGVRLPADALLGTVDDGFRLGMATLDRLRPSVGASACGMAARALRLAVDHAATRTHSAGTLADLGVVREKLGEMAAALDAARLLVYRAAWRADQGAARITLEAAMAKSFATETAQQIIDSAAQIVGGVGLLAGHPLERLARATRAARIYEGATEVQRHIIATALLQMDTP